MCLLMGPRRVQVRAVTDKVALDLRVGTHTLRESLWGAPSVPGAPDLELTSVCREPLAPAWGPDAWTCLGVPVQTLGSSPPALPDFPPPADLEQPVFRGVPLGPFGVCVCVTGAHV